jgi:hypothetical protein
MPSVGAVTSNLNVVAKTTNYLAVANNFVLMDATGGPRTVTLPTAPATNMLVAVKKSDSSTNAVTVVPGAGANINGDTACILAIQGASATFQYDGTNWQLLSAGNINTANPAAGIPSGGTLGQVLAKSSATNYDATWSTPAGGLPTGGTSAQVLTKNSATNYDASWLPPVSGGGGAFLTWTSGRVYTAPCNMGMVSASSPFTTNMFFLPMRIPNACTLSQMGVYSQHAGYAFYLGIYTDAGGAVVSQGPGTRLTGGAGSTVASSTTWISTPLTFAGATNVWVGCSFASTGISVLTVSGGMFSNLLFGAGLSGGSAIGAVCRMTASYGNGVAPGITDFSGVSLFPGGSQGLPIPVVQFSVA